MSTSRSSLDELMEMEARAEALAQDRYLRALSRHPDCRDPDHPGCEDCCEEEDE
jgi:hypothetical protein